MTQRWQGAASNKKFSYHQAYLGDWNMAIDGSWKLVVKSPMGDQKFTLTVRSEGAAFTGSLAGPGGSSEIENGKIDGDKAVWSAKLTVPFPMHCEFSSVLADDNLSGNVKVGAFGTAPFSGVRA